MGKDFFKKVQRVVEEFRKKGIRSNLLMRQIRFTALHVLTGEEQPDTPIPELHEKLLILLKQDPGHKITVVYSCRCQRHATTTEALAGGTYAQLDAKSLGMHTGPIVLNRKCPSCIEWDKRFGWHS